MSTNNKLMTGRMVRLDIAVTLYFLEPETLYGVTEVTHTRFETNEPMRRRLSRQILRKNLKPEATGQCPGGQPFGQFSGETLRGMYRDWEENEQRAMLALRLLRWIAAQKGKGCVSDPEPILHQTMRLTSFGLNAVLHDLATNEHPNPDAATMARVIRDLTPEARNTFLDRFGTKPIPGLNRPKEPEPKLKSNPKRPTTPMRIKLALAACVFICFMAVSIGIRVEKGEALTILNEYGPKSAAEFIVRHGLLYSPEYSNRRDSAFIAYRNGEHEKAIRIATYLQIDANDIPSKIIGDAYLIEGHSSLAMGDLEASILAYKRANQTYETPYDRTYAIVGIIKVLDFLQEDVNQYRQQFYQEYQKANDGAYVEYLTLEIIRGDIDGQPYFEEARTKGMAHREQEFSLAIGIASFCAGNLDDAYWYAANANAIATLRKNERAQMMALAIMSASGGNLSWLEDAQEYAVKNNDWELWRLIQFLENH